MSIAEEVRSVKRAKRGKQRIEVEIIDQSQKSLDEIVSLLEEQGKTLEKVAEKKFPAVIRVTNLQKYPEKMEITNPVTSVEVSNLKDIHLPEFPTEMRIAKPDWYSPAAEVKMDGVIKAIQNIVLNLDAYTKNTNPLAVKLTYEGKEYMAMGGGGGNLGVPELLPIRIVTPAGDSAMDEVNDAVRVNIIAGGAGNGSILDGVDNTIKASVLDYANSNPLAVRLTDTNGDYIAAGAGTQYTEDAAAAANPVGTVPILVRNDTPVGEVTDDGDNIAQRGTNYGAAYVTLLDTAGAPVSVGGGPQYTEDAAAPANPIGTALVLVREDARAGGLTTADGDNVVARGNNKGEMYVKTTDSDAILTTIDADTGNISTKIDTIAGAVSGAKVQIDVLSIAAGNNNIGDVDVASIAAGDNNIGNVDIVTVPTDPFGANADAASATGSISAKLRGIATALGITALDLGSGTGGSRTIRVFRDTAQFVGGTGVDTSATQRVSLATNVALPAGNNNIGDVDIASIAAGDNNIGNVDVVTLPSIPAGTNNIGDVDVLTVPADPFGANADAIVAAGAAGSIQAKLRRATQGLEDLKSLIVLAAGTNAIGKLAANSGVDIGDVDVVSLTGSSIAHDGVDSGNPHKIGGKAVAHGTNPTAVAAADRTDWYFNRAGVPFVIGGHPNVLTKQLNITDADGAQTDTAIVTVGAGAKIVVTHITVALDSATTASGGVAVRIGFGTANTPAADSAGIVLSHPGIAAGSGLVVGNGGGIIGVGADNEDLRVTCEDPVGGNLDIVVGYYTIES